MQYTVSGSFAYIRIELSKWFKPTKGKGMGSIVFSGNRNGNF